MAICPIHVLKIHKLCSLLCLMFSRRGFYNPSILYPVSVLYCHGWKYACIWVHILFVHSIWEGCFFLSQVLDITNNAHMCTGFLHYYMLPFLLGLSIGGTSMFIFSEDPPKMSMDHYWWKVENCGCFWPFCLSLPGFCEGFASYRRIPHSYW